MLNHATESELRRLYCEEGKSGKEIASIFGVSCATICNWMKVAGIKARKPHEYPPSEKQKTAWTKNGLSLSEYWKEHPEGRAALGKANKGKRRRDDYEFGGHEKLRGDGYIRVYVPDHPYSSADGYVMKHILVMERHIGRYLSEDEVVHHINRVRDDNRIENLQLMTKSSHMSMHMKELNERRRTERSA